MISALQPLSGILVVEFCNVAAGPYCAMLLADLGARVIKVEAPAGDTLRSWPPLTAGVGDSGQDQTFSENFASLNRNKDSVVLDLKQAADLRKAKALIARADVLVENNRPGAMARLGLGAADCRELNPALVYCSISAYGQGGPRAAQGGFDVTVQAIAGLMSVTGEPGGAPVKAGVPVADFAAGLYGAMNICAQLSRRDRVNPAEDKTGCHIDVPMMGTTLAIAALQTSEYFGSGLDPKALGSAHPRNAPYRAFKARDDWFVLAAGTQSLWQTVCQTLQRPELIDDARFVSTTLRARNQEALRELLEEEFVKQDAAHWISLFENLGVPCVGINRYSQALQDPQVLERGWVQDQTLANGAKTRTFVNPVRVDGQPSIRNQSPPGLGAHQHVLDE